MGRRQTEHNFTATTSLALASTNEDEEAGLTLIQNNTHHYDVLLKRKNGKYAVQLRVTVRSLTYSFSYLDTKTNQFKELKKLYTRYLSTEVAGGFTGVMIGLYASSNGHETTAKAFFDWFDYRTLSQ